MQLTDGFGGLLPVFTLLLGFAASSLNEWFRDKRAKNREHEARMAARRERLSDRRADFQRQTLLDLQEAVLVVTRSLWSLHSHDLDVARTSGHWELRLIPEELNQEHASANAKTILLAARVRNDEIRSLAGQLRDRGNVVMLCDSETSSRRAIQSIDETFLNLNEKIGELLRKLDDDAAF